MDHACRILGSIGKGEASVDEHTRKATVPSDGGAKRLAIVIRDFDEAGIAIDDIALRRPTLDDVFLSLTGHVAEVTPDQEPVEAGEVGMTTETATAPRGGASQAIRDGLLIGWRNLKRVPRIPELAIFAIIQSIMFVLLFAFVFGGAINVPGGIDYTPFLMPGIFAQTIVFAAGTTAIGMTDDINKGIIDRFRSLPMSRSAVLTGRTFADVVYNAGILVVLMVTGFVVGWRVEGIGSLIAGFALLLFFAYGMVWLGVYLGMNVPTVEVGQQVIFTTLFPITFISNVFVPLESLPDWLQPVAEWNPTSTLTAALREMWGNALPAQSDSLAAREPLLVTLVWVVVIVAVFAPLAVRRYKSMSR